jgi:hypothetical protein
MQAIFSFISLKYSSIIFATQYIYRYYCIRSYFASRTRKNGISSVGLGAAVPERIARRVCADRSIMPMSSRESLLLRKVLIHCRFNDGSDRSLHELESETQPYLQLDALFGHDQLAIHTIATDDQVIALPS